MTSLSSPVWAMRLPLVPDFLVLPSLSYEITSGRPVDVSYLLNGTKTYQFFYKIWNELHIYKNVFDKFILLANSTIGYCWAYRETVPSDQCD